MPRILKLETRGDEVWARLDIKPSEDQIVTLFTNSEIEMLKMIERRKLSEKVQQWVVEA